MFFLLCFTEKAFAEELHERIRKELWGYQMEEELDIADILKIKYQVKSSFDLVNNREILFLF